MLLMPSQRKQYWQTLGCIVFFGTECFQSTEDCPTVEYLRTEMVREARMRDTISSERILYPVDHHGVDPTRMWGKIYL